MCMLMNDDASDLTAARAGDAEAFARLYDRHAGVVLSLCRCRCPFEAEDALQDTFLRAWRMLDSLADPRGLRRWLYAIARRVCAERRRSAIRRSNHEDAAIAMRRLAITCGGDLHDAVEQGEQLARLSEALAALPDDERLAIHLFYLERDPVAAAVEAMGVSRSGFYKLVARGRKHLAALMRDQHVKQHAQ